MPEQSEGTPLARVTLEEFVDAVTRGVLRAIDAHESEVSGYLQAPSGPGGLAGAGSTLPQATLRPGPITIGIWYNPTQLAAGGGGGTGKLQ
jgi:hypothetical protein